MKKVYIIGAVTGLPVEEVQAKFAKASLSLKNMGMMPVNPIDLIVEDMPWNDAMKICIRALMDCDMIMLLPDWYESKGATLEVAIARNFDLPELRFVLKTSRL